jgi:hypothetical protein
VRSTHQRFSPVQTVQFRKTCVCVCLRAYLRACWLACILQIRLHKDELKEEVFLIQVQNSWNKAHKMLNSWEKEGVVPPLPAHH